MFIESNLRAFTKAVSWRLSGTFVTIFLAYLFTRKIEVALTIGGLETVAKIVLYYIHERAWNNIHYGKRELRSGVIWLTGLSGAGKTTIANAVSEKLKKKGYKVEGLDGDLIRDIFPATGFSREDRDQHIRRVGFLASRLESHGIVVIASLISPYEDSRSFVKNLCRNYYEVYINTPLEICESRDPKGLYKKARAGLIKSFTGIDAPYEIPKSPQLNIETTRHSPDESAELILKGFLGEPQIQKGPEACKV